MLELHTSFGHIETGLKSRLEPNKTLEFFAFELVYEKLYFYIIQNINKTIDQRNYTCKFNKLGRRKVSFIGTAN